MSIALTDTQVLAALLEVAGENPEKVYETPASMRDEWGSCFYVHHDEDGNQSAGCIVGHVLHRLGVPLAALKEVETLGADSAVEKCTSGVSERMRNFLRSVQRKQDDGYTWGDSLRITQGYYSKFSGLSQSIPAAVA